MDALRHARSAALAALCAASTIVAPPLGAQLPTIAEYTEEMILGGVLEPSRMARVALAR